MNARDFLVAELDRRIGLCRAATPGPWSVDANAVRDEARTALALTYPRRESPYDPTEHRANAAFIAAHDPTSLAALYEWMRGEVGHHALTPCRTLSPGWFECRPCSLAGMTEDDTCVFVAGLASALGYPGGGGESIVCHDYPNCDREHAGGAGGVPVHPPEGSRVSGDEPLIPDVPPAAPVQSGGAP